MVDFRKWFPALAVGALVIGSAAMASAQTTPALQCVANAGATPLVRAEGLTELVGDVVLNCTGGTPTAAGAIVPQVNIQIFLNTNVTSRLVATNWSEALILIDDPARAQQNPCLPAAGATSCPVTGVGSTANNGRGVNFANGASIGVPNVFQAHPVANSPNSLTWLGVPIDPPGTNGTRTIRITNVRADASFLSQQTPNNTFIPTQITMFISITPPQSLPLNNPQQTVAYLSPGLNFSVRGGAPVTFLQCNANNPAAATGGALTEGVSFLARFTEGFASSFKRRNVAPFGPDASGAAYSANSSPTPLPQDSPGGICQTCAGGQYFTETGFYNPAFTTTNGLNKAGLADTGTRLLLRFNAVPNGATVLVGLYENGASASTSRVRLVSTDASGAGAFSAVSDLGNGFAAVSLTGGSGIAVYEVMNSDPLAVENIDIPVAISFTPNVSGGNTLPALGTATVVGELAPVSTVHTADATSPIPRFVDNPSTKTVFTINPCSTNLLFPFVTNQAGYDTGFAISNTSADPFGTPPQSGTCTVNYYPTNGTGAPATAPVTPTIAAGTTFVFTLSQGNAGATPAYPAAAGFQGYVIAQCRFQFAHGYAFISSAGAASLTGVAQGYLALVMDAPIPTRTGFASETLGN